MISRILFGLVVALGLVTAPGADAQEQSAPKIAVGEEMTAIERQILRDEIRAYLLENPEVIMEAIQVLEARRKAQEEADDAALVAANRGQLLDDGYSWVWGNPEGDVTVVEFSDYRCPYCKKAHPEVRALIAEDPNIRYVLKEFPILGTDSIAAARLALAAAEMDPERFADLNDALMRFPGQLTEEIAWRIAEDEGWDVEALRKRAADSEIEARIRDTYRLARALGINGTPGFVIGDRIIRGLVSKEELAQAVAEAREATN